MCRAHDACHVTALRDTPDDIRAREHAQKRVCNRTVRPPPVFVRAHQGTRPNLCFRPRGVLGEHKCEPRHRVPNDRLRVTTLFLLFRPLAAAKCRDCRKWLRSECRCVHNVRTRILITTFPFYTPVSARLRSPSSRRDHSGTTLHTLILSRYEGRLYKRSPRNICYGRETATLTKAR